MRVFLAGATGVIGRRLMPLLLQAGHEVAAMTRSSERFEGLRELGADPVKCDVYDRYRLMAVVAAFEPDLVMHQLTDLPDDPAALPGYRERNDRMRSEGTQNLLAAAKVAAAQRVVAQSIAWQLEDEQARAIVEEHERAVRAARGVVVRYGRLYGPGTFFGAELPYPPRVHVDDAARLTMHTLEAQPHTTFVVEDAGTGAARSEGVLVGVEA